jgi:ABC-2 type transport system permease protein
MIRTLLLLNLKALFSGMFKRSRQGKKRSMVVTVLIALLVIYVVAVFFGMSGFMFFQICNPLFQADLGWLYFSLMGITVFALCFVSTIFAAQSQIFSAKDNELLLSMPVKTSAVLISRIAALLVLDYVFEAFVVIPAGFVWIVSQPVTAAGVIFFILSALVLPLTALAFACLFAWLISIASARMRNKNVIVLILSLLFLFAYFWVYSHISNYITALILNGAQISEAIQKAVFPAYHLGVAIEQGSVVSMMIFLLCAIVPFIIAVYLLSVNFIKIATTNRGAAKIKYTEKALKVSGVRMAFVRKELSHFWANPMYIMNAALGGAFMLVLAVLTIVKRDVVLNIVSQMLATGLPISSAMLVCMALSCLGAMNFVSAPSVSLEGKNLWIAKSLPVRPIDILMAKVQMHLLVCGIPAAVSALICGFTLGSSPLQFILLLIVPTLFTVLIGLFGVVINLQFPRFDWVNEIQPVKQGASTMLTMFGAIAFIAVLVILYIFVLSAFLAIEYYLLVCVALFAVLSLILYGYLRRGGSRRFESLAG